MTTEDHSLPNSASYDASSNVFISQISSSVLVSMPSPPSPAPSTSHDNSPPSALSSAELDLLMHFQQLQRGKIRHRFITELLGHCDRDELVLISKIAQHRLKRDFLRDLPTELSLQIVSYLDDPRSICAAASVCRFWRHLMSDQRTWKDMCANYGYALPEFHHEMWA